MIPAWRMFSIAGFIQRDFNILHAAGMHTMPMALSNHGSAAAATPTRMESLAVAQQSWQWRGWQCRREQHWSQSQGHAASFLHSAHDLYFSACSPMLTQPPMMAFLEAMPQEVAKVERERASTPSRAHRCQGQQKKSLPECIHL